MNYLLMRITGPNQHTVESRIVQADTPQEAFAQGMGPGQSNALGLGVGARPESAILQALSAGGWALAYFDDTPGDHIAVYGQTNP